MVLSEVFNELSTTTLFVERERGDVEFDSIRVFIFLFETQLNVNLLWENKTLSKKYQCDIMMLYCISLTRIITGGNVP